MSKKKTDRWGRGTWDREWGVPKHGKKLRQEAENLIAAYMEADQKLAALHQKFKAEGYGWGIGLLNATPPTDFRQRQIDTAIAALMPEGR